MAECSCPVIHDSDWDQREHRWAERYFLYLPMKYFFHVPLGAPEKLRRLMDQVAARQYVPTRPLQIFFQDGLFQGRVLVGIEKPLAEPGTDVVCFREAYWLTRVHCGPYGTLAAVVRDLKKNLAQKGKSTSEVYFWHVTCPACRNEQGGDKTVIWARI